MRSRLALAVTVMALVAGAASDQASSPSVAQSGTPTYTTSSEGLRTLFANPFDCEEAATKASTWVIELDQPETVFSFQVAVVDASKIEDQEQVTVRVGDSDPATEGSSSNSLCAVADIDSSSAMTEYECETPVSGMFITVTRNDGGEMNVCGFSASLGAVALPPVSPALGPVLQVPAADLIGTPSPAQNAAAQLLNDQSAAKSPVLPVLGDSSASFAASKKSMRKARKAAAPKAPVAAPISAVSFTSLPVLGSLVPAPAPAPVQVPAPAPAPSTTPLLVLPVEVSDPALAPAAAPTTNSFAAQEPQPTEQTADSNPAVVQTTAAPHKHDLTSGQIVGTVVACIVGAAIIATVGFFIHHRRNLRKAQSAQSLSSRVNPVYQA